MIREIMSEKKLNQRDQTNNQLRDVMRFVPDTIPVDRASEYIIKALEMYNRYLETERKKKTRSSRNER